MKPKIINILHHPPAYESCSDKPRPEINWDTPDGSWVGIGGYDWPDLVGKKVLSMTDEFEYEVWQPDLRADKIYEHRFECGLIHKLFPAHRNKKLIGLKFENIVISDKILKAISHEMEYYNIILHINNIINYLSYRILKKYELPILIQFHSMTKFPFFEKKKLRKNIFKNFYYHSIDKLLVKRNISFVYNNSNVSEEQFKSRDPISVKRIFMGIDFNYYKPKNYPENKTHVFSVASRFVKLKQIDKLINVFKKIDNKGFDFKLIIAGHGKYEYEKYLKILGKRLINKGKLKFPGYIRGEKLKDLYYKSDLFISASTAEGGPVSVMKAIACKTPVMCTKVGGVDDILEKYNAGLLVDPYDYKQWEKELINVLNGKKIKTLDKNIAKKYFHWPNIADKFIKIYKNLLQT